MPDALLRAGTALGPYDVLAPLGTGGMGEVYRARDRSLNREVAVKVLPAVFAADPDRVARFTREAHVLAQLNDPHIAHIYGIEQSGPMRALVMELVAGPTLADVLAARAGVGTPGGLPVPDALDIARQIALALEAAHEQGIVHRDLKPANVKVRPDGVVKVLDFGLAKAMMADPASDPIADQSPTFTSPAMTHVGVILGTAAYMSPEQARGRPVDRRADIWAFGCVLYEMLAGDRPFAGETVPDLIAAIVSRQPDWTALPADTPAAIRRLLVRCLEKDPRRRLRDIGEARVALEDPHAAAESQAPAPAGRRTRRWAVPVLAGTAAVLAIATGTLLVRERQAPADSRAAVVTRFDLALPPDASVNSVLRPAVSLSAGGGAIAIGVTAEGVNRILLRRRADAGTSEVPNSTGATNPSLSPDGRSMAFFEDGQIWKSSLDGAATRVGPIADPRGIAWTDDGTALITADAASPLLRMTIEGGERRPATRLAPGERTHRWPSVVRGRGAVLFTVGSLTSPDDYDASTIDVVDLASGQRSTVIKDASMARWCGDGHVVFARGAGLFAVGFDEAPLTTSGTPVQIASTVDRDASTGAAHFDCSSDGTLAYVPGSPLGDLRQIVLATRSGELRPARLAPGPYQEARLSPDGRRVALLNGSSGGGDVWLYDFKADTFTRLTFTGANAAPMWSADGRSVYYTAFEEKGARTAILKKPADGGREAVVLGRVPGRAYVGWIDRDERSAVISIIDPANDRGNIVRVRLGAVEAPIERLVSSPANEYAVEIDAKGQWLAYQSDETGRPEVYVRALAGSCARWQVTTTGGEEPHWSRDGRELFYRSANRLMAVPIDRGATFKAGNAHPLFDGIYNFGIESGRSYDVGAAPIGFLLVRPADAGTARRTVRVVLDWARELPRTPTR